jgi:hypothetical protein
LISQTFRQSPFCGQHQPFSLFLSCHQQPSCQLQLSFLSPLEQFEQLMEPFSFPLVSLALV